MDQSRLQDKNPVVWDTPVRFLKGVGPERSKALATLGIERLEDVFYYFPRRYEDRTLVKRIGQLQLNEKDCVAARVSSRGFVRRRSGQGIFRVVLMDEKDTLFATWFNQPYLAKVFLPNTNAVLIGRVEKEGGHFHMIHPEYEIRKDENSGSAGIHFGRIVPIYPLTEEVGQKGLRHFMFKAMESHSAAVDEFLPAVLRRRQRLIERRQALRDIHFPASFKDLEAAYRRLVFDEFFLMQLLIQKRKNMLAARRPDHAHLKGEERIAALIATLPFALTKGQRRAVLDIVEDMKKDAPMNRLLEADVGSGKTVVAAAALAFTTANGFQGALMAPTEVLAQQLYFVLSQWLEPLGISCGYLAQGQTAEDKNAIVRKLAEGNLGVVIGTHALLENKIVFKNLGLVVIDEQHKFGVYQRSALREKSGMPSHLLLMTATPIPRTLAMTLYGDLDISIIAESPKGRKGVKTYWISETKRAETFRFIDGLLSKGQQGFVVCPLVNEREQSTLKSAEATARLLSQSLSNRRVGLLHGQMKSPEKEKIMQEFKSGRLDLLVSTVVIEVGIDVPNASILVIENAERFGMAQLHQLRGRIGRGKEESFCFLFSNATDEETVERLSTFESLDSGFALAEKDLEIRGAGDIVGAKQHGMPKLRIGDLVKDIELLTEARKEAVMLLQRDPTLTLPAHKRLKKCMEQRFQNKGLLEKVLT